MTTNPHLQISHKVSGSLPSFLLALTLGFALGVGLIGLVTSPISGAYSEKLPWYVTRSSGTVGYLLLSLSTIWGLLLSSKIVKESVPAWLSMAMHGTLSWCALGLSVLHALVLLLDNYYHYALLHLLVPFTGPYRPAAVALGIIGLYLMLLTSASFYFRRRLGHKNWRRLHYLTFVSYLMVTWHGLSAGSDSSQLVPIFMGSALTVVFLTSYRLVSRAQRTRAV